MKVGYVRVINEEKTLNLQIEKLNQYGVDKIYQEQITSSLLKKSVLNELLSSLKTNDTLVIYTLDRLGLTISELMTLVNDFINRNIHLVSLAENLDTTTPSGKFVFHVLCSIHKMDKNIITERLKDGQHKARKKGRIGGRPRIEKKTVDRAIQLYKSKKYTINDITTMTGISKNSLYNYLKKEKEGD